MTLTHFESITMNLKRACSSRLDKSTCSKKRHLYFKGMVNILSHTFSQLPKVNASTTPQPQNVDEDCLPQGAIHLYASLEDKANQTGLRPIDLPEISTQKKRLINWPCQFRGQLKTGQLGPDQNSKFTLGNKGQKFRDGFCLQIFSSQLGQKL